MNDDQMPEDDHLLQEAQELYSLPPEDFTAARNEAVARLKGQDRALSERVKSLRKPAMAAWVVNMLVRHNAEEMTQVLDLGESLRQAQADLDGDALRELARQRRRLISAVAGKGRTIARDLGLKVSESVMRQVEETLHAAMIDTDAAVAVRTGLLVDALSATGVGSLKVATAVADHTALGGRSQVSASRSRRSSGSGSVAGQAGQAGLSVVPEPDPEERRREERRKAREVAATTVESALAQVASARGELESHEQSASDLQAETLQVNGEIDELRRRIDGLEDRLEQLDEKLAAAQEERDEAAEAVALAESSLAEAQAELDRLSGD